MEGWLVFERTYSLMSPATALAYPLAGLGVGLFMYVAIGSLDPSLEIDCTRSVAGAARCTARESTLLGTERSMQFAPSDAQLGASAPAPWRGSALQILTPSGPLPLQARVNAGDAASFQRQLEVFARSAAPALSLHAGFSGKPFLFMVPLMVLLMLGPVAVLGGKLVVVARPGEVRVRRVRFAVSSAEQTFAFPPDARPQFVASSVGGRYRSQGRLQGEAGGARVWLGGFASLEVLCTVADDLTTFYA